MKMLLKNILDGLSGKTAKPADRSTTPDSGQIAVDASFADDRTEQQVAPATSTNGLAYNSSGADYEEFLRLMKLGTRPFRKPGLSVMQEYEMWLAHRAAVTSADRVQA